MIFHIINIPIIETKTAKAKKEYRKSKAKYYDASMNNIVIIFFKPNSEYSINAYQYEIWK